MLYFNKRGRGDGDKKPEEETMRFWNVVQKLIMLLVVVALVAAGVIYAITDSPKVEKLIEVGVFVIILLAVTNLALRGDLSYKRRGW